VEGNRIKPSERGQEEEEKKQEDEQLTSQHAKIGKRGRRQSDNITDKKLSFLRKAFIF